MLIYAKLCPLENASWPTTTGVKKIFPAGPKVMKLNFNPLQTKKTSFFAKI